MMTALSFCNLILSINLLITCAGCANNNSNTIEIPDDDSIVIATVADDSSSAIVETPPLSNGEVPIEKVHPDSLVAFARTLIGVPYLYASTDPAKGFDCSGFITYVFNHFNIKVPRSSVDFTNYGQEVAVENARPGDLILFTGTDSTIRIVGHMGIVENIVGDRLYFIHSSSGKAMGVVITPLERYYLSRFVKVIRVFADEYFE
jgi:cell wall-associated NlpC family hydrolase